MSETRTISISSAKEVEVQQGRKWGRKKSRGEVWVQRGKSRERVRERERGGRREVGSTASVLRRSRLVYIRKNNTYRRKNSTHTRRQL